MNRIRCIREIIFRATQAEFAKIAGCRQPTVCRWESGRYTEFPSLDALERIRNAAIARDLAWDDRLFFEDMPLTNGASGDAGAASR